MGLLDNMLGSSMDDPKTMAVMNLAAGLLGGGNFGQALGRGLGGYQETMANAKKTALLDEQFQWQRDEHTRLREEAARKQNMERLIQQQFMPTTGTQAIKGDALGPTVDKAQNIGQMPSVNWQQLAAAGVPMDRLKALAEAPNLGRSKVARTVKGVGPDGREYEYQFDEYGQKVGDGMAQFRAPLMQDTGGKILGLDPYTNKPIFELPKTMTPDGMASDQRGRASHNLALERFNFEKQGGGKPQFNAEMGGFVVAPSTANPQGQFIPLPNASAQQPKLTEGESKASLYLGQMRSASDVLNQLESRDVSASPFRVNMTGNMVGNWLAGEGAQQVAQAQNQWSESYLRAKTGAAATEGEVKLNNATFFPQPNDSDAVIRQKAQARKQAELDMTLPAGRGATRLMTAQPKPAAPGMLGSGTANTVPSDILQLLNKY